jgi:AmmeMemoRadiSam system protein B
MTTPAVPHRPRLRHGLAAARDDAGAFVLYDPNRIGAPPLALAAVELAAVQHFTGRLTLPEIRGKLAADHGVTVAVEHLAGLADRLDAALFLDSPAFAEYLTGPVRRPACVGVYPEEPAAIHEQMRGLFTAPGGPGLPSANAPRSPRLRAVLVPHMDYARGGVTYGWGFKELAERTDAKLFVIVATSHYSPERFTLSRMNFATPLGTAVTDQAYIDHIVSHYGDGLFDDPVAHLPEHSVELEVVLLQHLFGPAVRIVPLVCGSLADRVRSGRSPADAADVARMAAALRSAEAAAGEPVCYVISGDLAHVGPKFGDPDPVGEPFLAESRRQDDRLLAALGRADAEAYFRVIADEGDRRRICGLPPTYLTLLAAGPASGTVLHYGRYVHPAGHESVSFAAAAFYA